MSVKEINQVSRKKTILLICMLVIVFGLLSGAIYLVTRQSTPGTDFFIYYTAAGNITRRGISPYSENVGEESQIAILKRTALQNEDQLRFVYPLYALLPVLPLANLSFSLAQSMWMSFGLLTLSISFITAFPKSPLWLVATLLLFYPIFFGFLLGNFDILIISMLFLLLAKIPHLSTKNQLGQIMAGIPLAWITIKPQFVWFYFIFLGLIIYKKKLKTLAISFNLTLAGMVLISLAFVPNWMEGWISLILRYPSYTGNQFVFTPLFSPYLSSKQMQIVYGSVFVIMLIVLVYLTYRHLKGHFSAFCLLSFGAFFTYLFHPTDVAYEQLTFILPVIIWIIHVARTHPKIALAIWFSLVCASWSFFFLGRFGGIPLAATSGLFILYTVWLIFGSFFKPKFLQNIEFIN